MKLFGLTNEAKTAFDAYICDQITKMIPDLIAQKCTILDFGCGDGQLTQFVRNAFFNATLYGVDTNKDTIESAVQEFQGIHFQFYTDYALPFENNTFDLIYAVNVFHHIQKNEYDFYAKEILRVLKPKGKILIFEFNPLNIITSVNFKRDHLKEGNQMVKSTELIRLFDHARSIQLKYYYLSSYVPEFLREYMQDLPFGSLYSVLVCT
jgi:SAM-dependent methyltransferase